MRQCLAGRPGLYGKALLAAMCVAAPVLLAQDNAPQSAFPAYVPTMTFDVAAVRQTKPDATLGFTVWGGFQPPNSSNFVLQNNSIANLIGWAYPGGDHKVDGYRNLPTDLRSAMFDISAKADAASNQQLAKLPEDQVRLKQAHMVQVLLAERFNLKVHWETRDSSTYDLVATNPKRMQTTGAPPSDDVIKAAGNKGVPPLYQSGSSQSGFEFIAHAATMADLADMLRIRFGAPVTDKTGLAEKYYFDLRRRAGAGERQQRIPHSLPRSHDVM
jgi:uncharacterized protein (TIGR03435 family)